MNQPHISIIVATYNRRHTLEQCLSSIWRNCPETQNYEVIVVDDGSTDNTWHFLKEQETVHQNLRIFKQHNKGPGGARNTGVEKALGSIVAFTDDDCVVSFSWLNAIVDSFGKEEIVALEGPIRSDLHNITPLMHFIINEKPGSYLSSNMAYQRDIFLENGGFDGRFRIHEDTDLGLRTVRSGKIGFNSAMLVDHPPRKLSFFRELGNAWNYGKIFLNSEHLIYFKHRADYHRVRYRKTFHTTIANLLIKYVISYGKRPAASAIRHPLEFAGLLFILFLQQLSVGYYFFKGIIWGFDSVFAGEERHIDIAGTNRVIFGNDKCSAIGVRDLFIRMGPLRKVLRRAAGKPVYGERDRRKRNNKAFIGKKQRNCLLLRVDDFPGWRNREDALLTFHGILRKRNIPYLIGATLEPATNHAEAGEPQTSPLTSSEVSTLQRLAQEGVEIAMHGIHHKRRHPAELSETAGMSNRSLHNALSSAQEGFRKIGIQPKVYIPPFNACDLLNFLEISKQFPIICGGPETVRFLGFNSLPLIIKNALYLSSYPPAYDLALGIRQYITRSGSLPGINVLCLHWEWEAEDSFKGLVALADELVGKVNGWSEIIDEVETIRNA